MDSLKSSFDALAGDEEFDAVEDEAGADLPPDAIGQDERRMQVRAYNHWASLLHDRHFPGVEDLDPASLPDFGPYSVLLDFTGGLENPGISFMGAILAEECGASTSEMQSLKDIPNRSLLSRITDHYMQILANQAPIGFEAEFVNQRGATIMYRGILLPFSSDDDAIDFIYGVINWKELADQHSSDELLLEIDQVLEPKRPLTLARKGGAPLTDWADGPGAAEGPGATDGEELAADLLASPASRRGPGSPAPRHLYLASDAEADDADAELDIAATAFAALDPEDMELAGWLGAAREMAATARSSEARTRTSLYDAIALAYDFSLAAAQDATGFAELLEDAGLKMQERAAMTPVVKLVFGVDYDKTRLTEYAAALSHAHRLGLEQGSFAGFLRSADGGLKAIVAAERRLRREQAGKAPATAETRREALAGRLRTLDPQDFASLSGGESEFALVMIRRTGTGDVVMLGEVPEDAALVERAARRLLD